MCLSWVLLCACPVSLNPLLPKRSLYSCLGWGLCFARAMVHSAHAEDPLHSHRGWMLRCALSVNSSCQWQEFHIIHMTRHQDPKPRERKKFSFFRFAASLQVISLQVFMALCYITQQHLVPLGAEPTGPQRVLYVFLYKK